MSSVTNVKRKPHTTNTNNRKATLSLLIPLSQPDYKLKVSKPLINFETKYPHQHLHPQFYSQPILENYKNTFKVPMVRAYVTVARIHASHPSLNQSRPPRPPSDTRDDRNDSRFRSGSSSSEGEHKSQSDYGSIKSNDASFMTMHKRNDHIILCIEEALLLQREKLGNEHPSVTRTLHSLALEYKVRGRYDKAMYYLKNALELLTTRMTPFSNIVNQGEDERDDASIGSCESSICVSSVESFASSVLLGEAVVLYEEMSVVYSCMGNIYMLRGMYNEAADCYINSVNMLVEADYDGASARITMMLRILKRAENRRRQHKQTRGNSRANGRPIRPSVRRGSATSLGSASSFGSTGIKSIGSSFETTGASWASVGQMSV